MWRAVPSEGCYLLSFHWKTVGEQELWRVGLGCNKRLLKTVHSSLSADAMVSAQPLTAPPVGPGREWEGKKMENSWLGIKTV